MRTTQHRQLPCGFTEDLLIAEALGETAKNVSQQVAQHLVACLACRQVLDRYQQLRAHLSRLFSPQEEKQGLRIARRQLETRLRLSERPRLQLKIWRSPVGDIRLGKTEKGVALVEFVRAEEAPDFLPRWRNDFIIENNGTEVSSLIQKLEDYFSGKTHALEWTVDEILMRSDFQREVLRATADVPYGTAVTYQGIAETIGQPKAVRAVAQALRYNPLPIHIPCHRVIGSDGALTGYAGNLIEIKQKILAVEGIPVMASGKGLTIPRSRMYIGWRHERSFCRPDCSCLKDQPAGDRAFIPSQTRAEALGYSPCDICRPDRRPLVSQTELGECYGRTN